MGCGIGRRLPPATDPLTLYVWPGSAPCRAVMMTTRAANIEVTLVNINVMKAEQRNEDFKKMNPDHTVPVLVDKRREREICNSHEIMPYIMDMYAPEHAIYPSDTVRRTAIDNMLKYDEETVYPVISRWVYPQIFRGTESNEEDFTKVRDVLDHLNESLSSTPYLAYRSLSIADLAVAANLSLLELVYFEVKDWKHIWNWLKKIKGLAYYALCNSGLENWKLALHIKEQEKLERKMRAEQKQF